MEEKIIVTNIQRMCFSDGPGIRTTVFLKGCSIHCPWCSNPENISLGLQKYKRNGFEAIYGEEYTTDDLIKLIVKDHKFWKSEGGVTFSGGEALLHAKKIESLLKRLREMNVNIFFETSLFVPRKDVEMILPYIDGAFVDVKILDKNECKMHLGGNIDIYYENVEMLHRYGKIYKFRVPCSYEYTLTDENIQLMLSFFGKYKDIPIQLFAIHDLGREKYASLNLKTWEHKNVELSDITKLKRIFEKNDLNAEIIQI